MGLVYDSEEERMSATSPRERRRRGWHWRERLRIGSNEAM